MRSIDGIQKTLDSKTRRWWFFVGMLVLQVIAVPYASKNFDFDKWGHIISHALRHCFWPNWKPVFPVFQVIAIVSLAALFTLRNRFGPLFALYAGVSYFLFAALQCIGISPKYGLCVATVGITMFGLVAATWIWEAVAKNNDFSETNRSPWKYLAVPPAILAFWAPLSPTTGRPDFAPVYFLTSGSALTFCMMTPVFITALLFFYPRVNMLTLRMTGLVGTIIALYNVIPKLASDSVGIFWNGILHLPLLILSIVALVLSMRRQEVRPTGSNGPACRS